MQESITAKATLDEDPALLARMLQVFRTNEYSDGSISDTSQPGCGQFGHVLDPHCNLKHLLHAKMYAVADRFMVNDLNIYAKKMFFAAWEPYDTISYDEKTGESMGADSNDHEEAVIAFVYESTPAQIVVCEILSCSASSVPSRTMTCYPMQSFEVSSRQLQTLLWICCAGLCCRVNSAVAVVWNIVEFWEANASAASGQGAQRKIAFSLFSHARNAPSAGLLELYRQVLPPPVDNWNSNNDWDSN